jgi:hypothetical protein
MLLTRLAFWYLPNPCFTRCLGCFGPILDPSFGRRFFLGLERPIASRFAPPGQITDAEKAARFASAEAMRWLEWGARSYENFTLAFAVLCAAAAARTTRILRPIAYLMGFSGLGLPDSGLVRGVRGVFADTHHRNRPRRGPEPGVDDLAGGGRPEDAGTFTDIDVYTSRPSRVI